MYAFSSIWGTVKDANPIKAIFNSLSSTVPVKKNLNIIMDKIIVINKLIPITFLCKELYIGNKNFLLSLKFFTLWKKQKKHKK